MKKLFTVFVLLACTITAIGCGGNSSPANLADADATGIDFPGNGQITIIVPYAAGGASDTTARIFASELEGPLGSRIIVTNVTGASGAVGLEQVRNAAADGYTMAYMPVESTMLQALGFTDLSTDDFSFIGRAMTIPAAITVRADSDWDTFEDFLVYAKENPGAVQVGNSGTGSIWHIAAASVEKECGVSLTHVPFDGAAPAIAALLGGNIQAVAVSPSEVKNNVDSGDFKVLCILGEGRSVVVPEILTAKEMGYEISIQGWGGFAVPAGTPAEVLSVLESAAEIAINSDAMIDLFAERGFEHAYLGGAQMDEKAKSELTYFSELIPSLEIIN